MSFRRAEEKVGERQRWPRRMLWKRLAETLLIGRFSFVSVAFCVGFAIAVSGYYSKVELVTDTEVRQ